MDPLLEVSSKCSGPRITIVSSVASGDFDGETTPSSVAGQGEVITEVVHMGEPKTEGSAWGEAHFLAATSDPAHLRVVRIQNGGSASSSSARWDDRRHCTPFSAGCVSMLS